MSELARFTVMVASWLMENEDCDIPFRIAVGTTFLGLPKNSRAKAQIEQRFRSRVGYEQNINFRSSLNNLRAGTGGQDFAIALYMLAKIDPLYRDLVPPIESKLFGLARRYEDEFTWAPAKAYDPPEFRSTYGFAVEDVFDEVIGRVKLLQSQFYGRDEELMKLSKFVRENDRGIVVISAPAGSGKSALLARWIGELAYNAENKIAQHFFWNLGAHTSSPKAARDSLMEQIAPHVYQDPEAENAPPSNLTDAMKRGPNVGLHHKLILIIDGLDEAAPDQMRKPFQPFFDASSLAKGVFVVVSGRHEESEREPDYLREWTSLGAGPVPFHKLKIDGLSDRAIQVWLGEKVPDASDGENAVMANVLERATTGFPLYLRFVIDDLERRFGVGPDVRQAMDFIQNLPPTFQEYVARQLELMAEQLGDKLWVERIRPFLATLSVLKGPILRDDLNHFMGKDAPAFEKLDYSVSRWLINRNDTLCFAHPRLTETFASVVGTSPSVALIQKKTKTELVRSQEKELIEWMRLTWPPVEDEIEARCGRKYPLDWLPDHLFDFSEKASSIAVDLLYDPNFLLERLREDPLRTSERLVRHCELLAKIPAEKRSSNMARNWAAFWATTEAQLRELSKLEFSNEISFHKTVERCLIDGLLFNGPRSTTANSRRPHPLPETRMLRSLDYDHPNRCQIRKTRDGFLSWDRTKIKSWTSFGNLVAEYADDKGLEFSSVEAMGKVGEVIAAGSDGSLSVIIDHNVLFRRLECENVHGKAIGGIRPLSGGFLTWSVDGDLGHWGRRLERGTEPVQKRIHDGNIFGIELSSKGWVSWGEDGLIKIWDPEFSPSSLTVIENQHTQYSGGLTVCGDRLVCWDKQGNLRFFDLAGKLLGSFSSDEQDCQGADAPCVNGVLSTFDRFWSFGSDGHLRLWSRDGRAIKALNLAEAVRPGRPDKLIGMQIAKTGIYGWSDQNIYTFENYGYPTSNYICENVHKFGASNVIITDETVVTAERYGQIRIWSADDGGYPSPPSLEKHHVRRAKGAFAHSDGFVSWDSEGEILFWDLEGQNLLDKWKPDFFRGAISHALELDEQIVTTGLFDEFSAIIFWDEWGRPVSQRSKFIEHQGPINQLTDMNGLLVSAGNGNALAWTDTANGESASEPKILHSGPYSGFFRHGECLVTYAANNTLRVWKDLNAGEPKVEVSGLHSGFDMQLIYAFPLGENILTFGSEDPEIKLLDISGNCIAKCNHGDRIGGLHPHDDGFVSWDDRGNAKFWTNSLEIQCSPTVNRHHDSKIEGFTKIGKHFASWDCNGALRFWDRNGERIWRAGSDAAHYNGLVSAKVKDDLLFTLGREGACRIWTLEGDLLEVIMIPGGATAFAVRNEKLALVGIRIWVYDLPDLLGETTRSKVYSIPAL